MKRASCYIGFDPREAEAFAVARISIHRHSNPLRTFGLRLDALRESGLYTRPTETRVNSDGRRQIWDKISDAPCSTEFSISRFLVPHLAQDAFAMFVDCDVLARANVYRLFEQISAGAHGHGKAVWCVKHVHAPAKRLKMDGQTQTLYARKNWSSVMVFDCEHPSNKKLTVEMVNTLPGRDLHRFCWLKDDEIGALPPEWNYLVGHTKNVTDPKIVHFTDGVPSMPGSNFPM